MRYAPLARLQRATELPDCSFHEAREREGEKRYLQSGLCSGVKLCKTYKKMLTVVFVYKRNSM